MNMPERPINPPEATVPNEPELDRDPLSLELIDTDVLQVGLLSERTQLAINDFNTEHGDMDVMAGLLEELLLERQELGLGLVAISNKLEAMTKRLKQAD